MMARPVFVLALWCALCAGAGPCLAQLPRIAAPFGASAIDERSGAPVFTFRGRPFFVYGAAFFYERLPRDEWRAAMFALKYRLHVNTLDLYVPWNWHELSDGNFDFDGRTNPRRDLREVLRLAHAFGFALVVRPGPVIRNEWRNGGYPAWLLARTEYGMPLRDLLEGRYPPTATLQNARSDDAANVWLHNATHRYYARRWLARALREFAPVAGDVIAIALDDDQGAYIDNQTWPAPHLRAYLSWLRACVATVTHGRVPVFINTYQMKVSASSPVWAMGNWYQSGAFALGEHDRTQLEFSTGLLQTRPHQPLMASEFQAGWLQQPQDVLPQAADPANTLLAETTLIAMGARGIINFPAQDTLYPAGYEVPFANAFYAWDAALGYGASENPRAVPTREVGGEIATFNADLAASRVRADAGIVWLPSAYDARTLTNADFATFAERTMTAQRFCRRRRLTCSVVDLRYAPPAALGALPLLIVPLPEHGPLHDRAFERSSRDAIAAYRRDPHVAVLLTAEPSPAALAAALRRNRHERYVDGADGTFAQAPNGAGFLSLVNYGATAQRYAHVVVRGRGGVRHVFARLTVDARSGVLLPLDIPLHPFDRRFAAADRVSATCPIVAIERARGGSARLAFQIAPGTDGCTFDAQVDGRKRASVLRSGVETVTLDAHGRITAPRAETRIADTGVAGTGVAHLRSGARTSDARRKSSLGGIANVGTLPIRGDVRAVEPPRPFVAVDRAVAHASDVYRDGEGALSLENDLVRVVVSPNAGARAFVFEDKARGTSAFTTVGALRDDVLLAPPLSSVDRIAKYTNQMPAGFFNRPYRTQITQSGANARVRFTYDAPDAYPQGGHFARVLSLAPHARCFTADLTNRFDGTDPLVDRQRAVSVSSLSVGDPRVTDTTLLTDLAAPLAGVDATTLASAQHALGLYAASSHELVLLAWSSEAQSVKLAGRKNSLLVRIAQAGGQTTRLAFSYEYANSAPEALARVAAFAASGCSGWAPTP